MHVGVHDPQCPIISSSTTTLAQYYSHRLLRACPCTWNNALLLTFSMSSGNPFRASQLYKQVGSAPVPQLPYISTDGGVSEARRGDTDYGIPLP